MINNILPHLYAFYLVAQHLNFTKAAHQLRVSQSAVSMQIKTLEEKLDVSLFHRGTRTNVALSREGQVLYQTCRHIIPQLESCLHDVADQDAPAVLRVSAPSIFGAYQLIPFTKAFEARHPDTEVQLQLTNQYLDLVSDHIDVAIRWARTRRAGLEYTKIFDVKFSAVASCNYLKTHGPIRRLRDLEKHAVIVFSTELPLWKLWLKQWPQHKWPTFSKMQIIDNYVAQASAITAGIGVGLFPHYAIDSHRSDSWEVVFPRKYGSLPLYACTLKSERPNTRIQMFIQELRAAMSMRCAG